MTCRPHPALASPHLTCKGGQDEVGENNSCIFLSLQSKNTHSQGDTKRHKVSQNGKKRQAKQCKYFEKTAIYLSLTFCHNHCSFSQEVEVLEVARGSCPDRPCQCLLRHWAASPPPSPWWRGRAPSCCWRGTPETSPGERSPPCPPPLPQDTPPSSPLCHPESVHQLSETRPQILFTAPKQQICGKCERGFEANTEEVYRTVASQSISRPQKDQHLQSWVHPSSLSLSANPFSKICVGSIRNHPLMIPRLSETAGSTFPARAETSDPRIAKSSKLSKNPGILDVIMQRG